MLHKTPTPTKNKGLLTSSTLQTLMILSGGADLVKANLFFEDCGQQFKGKVYAKNTDL